MASLAIPQRVLDRIWDRVDMSGGPDACWLWKLSKGNHGYGQIGWGVGNGRNAGTTAHRAAWTAANGPIPDGMTVDHICRVRMCCNPKHLRLLTLLANATDNGKAAITHCPAGHSYSGSNLRISKKGHRLCRACSRKLSNEYYWSHK